MHDPLKLCKLLPKRAECCGVDLRLYSLYLSAGVGLGCIASGATLVTDEMMLAAARAVAKKTTAQEIEETSILPAVKRLR